MQLPELIDAAAQQTGSKTTLAKLLQVTPQRINDWRSGYRPCPLTAQAQIAELAGEDAKEWVWQAVCHQLGRATAAVLLTLALHLTAISAPGVAGHGIAGRRAK